MEMTDTPLQQPITVVLEEAVPVRLEWNGCRYYVEAPPEPRGRLQVTPNGERPDPVLVTGWQLAASTVSGERHVFVVTSGDSARWWLTHLDP